MPGLWENIMGAAGGVAQGVGRAGGGVAQGLGRAGGRLLENLPTVMENVGIAAEGVRDPQYWQKQRLYRKSEQKDELNRLIQLASMAPIGSPERGEIVRQIAGLEIWPPAVRQGLLRLTGGTAAAQPQAGVAVPSKPTWGENWTLGQRQNYKIFYNRETGEPVYHDISQVLPDPTKWDPESPYMAESMRSLADARKLGVALDKSNALIKLDTDISAANTGVIGPGGVDALRIQAAALGQEIVEKTIPGGTKFWGGKKPDKKVYERVPIGTRGQALPSGVTPSIGGEPTEAQKAAAIAAGYLKPTEEPPALPETETVGLPTVPFGIERGAAKYRVFPEQPAEAAARGGLAPTTPVFGPRVTPVEAMSRLVTARKVPPTAGLASQWGKLSPELRDQIWQAWNEAKGQGITPKEFTDYVNQLISGQP